MKTSILMTAAMLSLAAAPAAAQMQSGEMQHNANTPATTMPAGSHMAMSRAERRTMARCKAMSHAAMMRSRACKNMMSMHPDMMSGG